MTNRLSFITCSSGHSCSRSCREYINDRMKTRACLLHMKYIIETNRALYVPSPSPSPTDDPPLRCRVTLDRSVLQRNSSIIRADLSFFYWMKREKLRYLPHHIHTGSFARYVAKVTPEFRVGWYRRWTDMISGRRERDRARRNKLALFV